MIERLLHLTALAGAAAGCALLLSAPALLVAGWGHPLVSGTVHLFTLGGVLSAAYGVQQGLWRQCYGAAAPVAGLAAPVRAVALAAHLGGLILLAWGFLTQDARLAQWGGHYGVPTGVVLFLLHGWLAARRRTPGAPRHAAAHLPGLGLAVAMALGALLVMEAYAPRWGIYTTQTIAAHALAAGFLFVLPQVLLPRALGTAARPAPGAPADGLPPLLRWYGTVAGGALGVLLVVLAQAGAGPPRLLPIGLAMLGALLVWVGLPAQGAGVALRAPWPALAGRLATGVALLAAALRTARGLAPGEALWLGKLGVLLFVLGVALPELLALLERAANVPGTQRRQALWLAGTAVLCGAQFWALPWGVRLGALLWLAGLIWHALAVRRVGPAS